MTNTFLLGGEFIVFVLSVLHVRFHFKEYFKRKWCVSEGFV